MPATLKTRNPSHGFYRTVALNYCLDGVRTEQAWDVAMAVLKGRFGASQVDARNFLDDRAGRHLADALTFLSRNSVFDALNAFGEKGSRDDNWIRKELSRLATPECRADFDAELGEGADQ